MYNRTPEWPTEVDELSLAATVASIPAQAPSLPYPFSIAPHASQETHKGVKFLSFDTTEKQLEGLSTELGVKALPAFKFYKVRVVVWGVGVGR